MNARCPLPLATALLGPVLLFQGRKVRRDTPTLAEPGGARLGQTTAGKTPLSVLLLGDSSAAGVGAPHQQTALLGQLCAGLSQYYSLRYRLEAATGLTTADCLERVRAWPEEPVDVVISVLGVNDVTGLRSPRRWQKEQAEMVQGLLEKHSPKLVILSGLPPMHRFPALPQPLRWYLGERARRLDAELDALAQVQGVLHLPIVTLEGDGDSMASDGFHPGPAAYSRWAALLTERIVSALNQELTLR